MNNKAATSNEPGAIHSMEKKLDWGPFKELKGLDVIRAHLIHGSEIPGCSVETALQTAESNPQSKTRGISMKLTALGLACQITPRNKDTAFFMIPVSNIKLLNFK